MYIHTYACNEIFKVPTQKVLMSISLYSIFLLVLTHNYKTNFLFSFVSVQEQ